MDKDIKSEKPANDLLVIADECGDSLWEAVLQQEEKACQVKNASKAVSALLNDIEKRQAGEETKGN